MNHNPGLEKGILTTACQDLCRTVLDLLEQSLSSRQELHLLWVTAHSSPSNLQKQTKSIKPEAQLARMTTQLFSNKYCALLFIKKK